MKPLRRSLLLLAAILIGSLALPTSGVAENWPCWRGPRGDGTCSEKDVPSKWDVADAVWKTEVPGVGHASAIVWGDRVFTVTALPEKLDRVLLCIDRATGKILWQQTVVHGPLEKINRENSYASGTPATDGQRVYVNFRVGDEIVAAAHDPADGKQLWMVRPGTHVGEWGFSNEPVLYGDKVIVEGQINVIRPGTTFDRVAQYELGEPCYASPAISDGQVFLRGFTHLYCIGK